MMCDKNTYTTTSASEEEETSIATILIGTQRDEDYRTTSNMSLWRKGVLNPETNKERMEAEDVKNVATSSNHRHHHADDTTSTGESSSSSIMEDEEEQQSLPQQHSVDDDKEQEALFISNETDPIEDQQPSQSATRETNVRRQTMKNRSFWILILGPTLMIGSIVSLTTPLIWDVMIHLSMFTWLCIVLFIIGVIHTCVTMVSIFNDQIQLYQISIIQYLDRVVLDNVLEQLIQAAAMTLMSISSLISLYLLPISQECRGELMDSSVGGGFYCQKHGWISDCTCDNKLNVSDIIMKQGGLIQLLRASLNHLSPSRTTTSTTTPLLILTPNETDDDDDNDDDDSNVVAVSSGSTNSSDDMVWNDDNYHYRGHTLALVEGAATTTTIIPRRRNDEKPTPTFDVALRRAMRECFMWMCYPVYVDMSTKLKQQRLQFFLATLLVAYYKTRTPINQTFMRYVLQPLLQRRTTISSFLVGTTTMYILRPKNIAATSSKGGGRSVAASAATTTTVVVVAAAAASTIMARCRRYYYSIKEQPATSSSTVTQPKPTEQIMVEQSTPNVGTTTATRTAAAATTTSSSSLTTGSSTALLLKSKVNKLKILLVRWCSNKPYKHVVLLLLAYAFAARRKQKIQQLLNREGGK